MININNHKIENQNKKSEVEAASAENENKKNESKKSPFQLKFHFVDQSNEKKNLDSYDRLAEMDMENDIFSINCMMFQEAYTSEQAGKIAQRTLTNETSGLAAIHEIEKIKDSEEPDGKADYAIEFIIQENCIHELIGIACGGVTIFHPWLFFCD